MQNRERLIYSVTQVAELLDISRASAYQAIQTGEIPHIKIGRRILIPRLAILAKLASAGEGGKENDNGNR